MKLLFAASSSLSKITSFNQSKSYYFTLVTSTQIKFTAQKLTKRFNHSQTVKINWKRRDGTTTTVDAPIGQNLMRIAHKNNIELEGACEGVCACSTCHVILEEGLFSSLPTPSENEDDMLDQAPGLTPTSRLGCQVVVDNGFEGAVVTIPSITRNFYVDGHTPLPH